ncbi:MAG TPA: zinc ribbon domain-containing protein [Phycisphaerae bacterium]|nr:zinc ribbon domain-containing protein [Phycisphaerae bacterium]
MPTYEYACEACGHQFEEFQSIKAKPIEVCPKCGKKKVKRLISGGAGFLFKGPGFYTTDYRSESYKTAAKAESGGGKSEAPAGKTEAAPAPAPAAPAAASAAGGAKPAAKGKK